MGDYPMLQEKVVSKHAIIEQFERGIASGNRLTDPYLLYNFKPFSDEVYSLIQSHLPADEAYFPMRHPEALRADGTSARSEFPLVPNALKRLTPEQRDFWGDFGEVLRAPELCDIYKKYLEPELTKRFNMPLSEIPAFPAPMLLRDTHGYKISVHHDTDTKVITTQYYLPADDSQRHLGTVVNERVGGGKFIEAHQLNFLPNKGYCFAVSKYSWHSVKPMSPSDGTRNSLMLLYYAEKNTSY
jgi:hypothetical protein